jgi:hypothetical protein
MVERAVIPDQRPAGTWIQTERALHEAWSKFLALRGALAASRVMHLFLSRLGKHNAVVISQKTIAALLECDERTVRRAVKMLADYHFIEIRQIGDRGTVNAYVVNTNVAWTGPRDGIRYALFSAAVVISDQEQPDRDALDKREPLQQFPSLYPGERQLPTGDGLPPPSQPQFPGLEPDLPARTLEETEL